MALKRSGFPNSLQEVDEWRGEVSRDGVPALVAMGWTLHRGGRRPVPKHVIVSVMLWDGEVTTDVADNFMWEDSVDAKPALAWQKGIAVC